MNERLSTNLEAVRARVGKAETTAGRAPGSVRLLAVSKSVGPEITRDLFELGCVELAENRAPAFEEKAAWFEDQGLRPRWHFIGHLQRNKARRVVRRAQVIHSVDSLRLLEALERLAGEEGRELEVYLQLNAARESQKHGIDPGSRDLPPEEALRQGELAEVLALCSELEHVAPLGLMAMGPLVSDQPASRVFEEVAGLARAIAARPDLAAAFPSAGAGLSLGMSRDLEAAVAAGSDVVRIGSALFEGLRDAGAAPRPR